MNRADYQAQGSNFELSLTKLVGKKVRDIYGHPTRNIGDTSFEVTRIIFEDLSEIWVGGEHDIAYCEIVDPTIPNLDSETLEGFMEPFIDDTELRIQVDTDESILEEYFNI